MSRAAIAMLALAVACFLGANAALRPLLGVAAERAGFALRYRSAYSLYPGHLTFRDVELGVPSNRASVRFERVACRVGIMALLRGELTLSRVRGVLAEIHAYSHRVQGNMLLDLDSAHLRAGNVMAGNAKLATDQVVLVALPDNRSVTLGRGFSLESTADSGSLVHRLHIPTLQTECDAGTLGPNGFDGLAIDVRTRGAALPGDLDDVQFVRASVERIGGCIGTRELRARIDGELELQGGSGSTALLVRPATIGLADVALRDADNTRHLLDEAQMKLLGGTLSAEGLRFGARIRARGDDAGVLLELAETEWLELMLSGLGGQPYRFEAAVHRRPGWLAVDDVTVAGDDFAVHGGYFRQPSTTRGAFFMRYRGIPIGMVLDDEGLHAAFAADEGWLARRLETLDFGAQARER